MDSAMEVALVVLEVAVEDLAEVALAVMVALLAKEATKHFK